MKMMKAITDEAIDVHGRAGFRCALSMCRLFESGQGHCFFLSSKRA